VNAASQRRTSTTSPDSIPAPAPQALPQ
jgi:hypothetical protein